MMARATYSACWRLQEKQIDHNDILRKIFYCLPTKRKKDECQKNVRAILMNETDSGRKADAGKNKRYQIKSYTQ